MVKADGSLWSFAVAAIDLFPTFEGNSVAD